MSERILHRGFRANPQTPWKQPEVLAYYDDDSANRIDEILKQDARIQVYDPIKEIADGLADMRYPDAVRDKDARKEFANDVMSQGDVFGVWVYYPWSSDLVHFPEPDDYHELRTYRFRNLLSKADIERLRMARVALFGMSVGSNIAVSLARNGIGGSLALGDIAGPSISNIGRAVFDLRDCGSTKLDAVAKKISHIDPFIKQVHFQNGINEYTVDDLSRFQPHIVGDEVDDMVSSAYLRTYSSNSKLPYVTVSDVHDTAVVEVSRHDIDPRAPLYASRIRDNQAAQLIAGKLSEQQQEDLFAKSVGYGNLTPQLIRSGMEIGRSLSGIPQLGSTALVGAGIATAVYREILLGNQQIKTGTFSVPITKPAGKRGSATATVGTLYEYMKHVRGNSNSR